MLWTTPAFGHKERAYFNCNLFVLTKVYAERGIGAGKVQRWEVRDGRVVAAQGGGRGGNILMKHF